MGGLENSRKSYYIIYGWPHRDTSGLRPTRQPPIPVGDSLSYQCPGMKSIKGKSSFIVKCNDLKQYVFPEDLASWGECQCSDTMVRFGYILSV